MRRGRVCAQVVPTVYVNAENRTILSNQYSVTEHFKASNPGGPQQSQLPGVFFFYDLSPIKAWALAETAMRQGTNPCPALTQNETVP